MKLLRNIGKVVGSGIFVLALSIVAVTIGLTKLTEYDLMKGLATDLISTQIAGSLDKNTLSQMHQMFLEQCKKSENIQLSEIVGQNISIKCEDIEKSTPEGLTDIFAGALFDSIYYKKYDCSFIECLQKPGQDKFSIFVSSEAHSFFKNLQSILLIVSGIGLVIMLVSIETWRNRFKSVGIILVSTALPVLVLIFLKDNLLQVLNVPADASAIVTPIIDQLFGSISTIFLVMLIVGIVLIIIGCILKHHRKANVGGK